MLLKPRSHPAQSWRGMPSGRAPSRSFQAVASVRRNTKLSVRTASVGDHSHVQSSRASRSHTQL